MATKLLTAILFMLKLFRNFRSNDIWHIDFSCNKVVHVDSTGPTNNTWSEKVWDHWLNANTNKKLLTACQPWNHDNHLPCMGLGLPDKVCTNTGHFDLSTVPDLSRVIFRKWHRENREKINIVKPKLIFWLYFGWLITFQCVCDAKITRRFLSTAGKKLHWKNCLDKIHY